MPEDLFNATCMDLDNCGFNGGPELKAYCRYLLGEAYMKKEGPSKVHEYVKNKSFEQVLQEIQGMIFKGENILNYEALLNSATEVIVNQYLEKKNQDKTGVNSFFEAVEKMVAYYSNDWDTSTFPGVISLVKEIVTRYFYKNEVNVFSTKNGARAYVRSKSREQLLAEMQDTLNLYSNVEAVIIDGFIQKVANSCFDKYTQDSNEASEIDNINEKIMQAINGTILNNAQKSWLASEFQKGNLYSLERYVPQHLIDQYKSFVEGPNTEIIQNKKVY